MPEGDTVWRTARRLHEALAGHEIVESDLRWPGIATADLTGRRTLDVVSRGKHLLHRVEGGLTLHSHLRMEGQWRIEATAALKPGWRRSPDLRALVAAPDWTALGLRLGMLDLVETARSRLGRCPGSRERRGCGGPHRRGAARPAQPRWARHAVDGRGTLRAPGAALGHGIRLGAVARRAGRGARAPPH